jgi:hypothetical protein
LQQRSLRKLASAGFWEKRKDMRARKKVREHEQLVRGALVQLFGLQLRSGTAAQELETLARECVDEAARTAQPRLRPDEMMFEAQDYGSVLRTWHRETNYLSPTGYPRALSIAGKSGLKNLIERYYPREHYRRVLLTLRKAGLIREQSNGKWLPTQKCAVFPKLNDELLIHVAEGISKLVQTVTQNVTSQRRDALFERSAKVRSFPTDSSPAYREFVNAQAAAFLSTVDDWLEAHSVPARTRNRNRKTCTAGIFAFAFIDDNREVAQRSKPTSRSKSPSRRSSRAR